MKFYRTYITKFSRSNGEFVYGGKHVSEHQDASNDSYYGSGREVKAAVRKYGRKCIISIEWFEHTKETYQQEEMKLIDMLKSEYGDMCTNRAKGGNGGYTMEYASDIQKLKHRENLSLAMSERWKCKHERKKQSDSQKIVQNRPEVKKKISEHHKSYYSRPEVRKSRSEQAKLTNSRPEVRRKLSDSNKLAKRTGLVWELYNSGVMTEYWNESNQLKYVSFSKWLKSEKGIDIIPSKLRQCLRQMERQMNIYWYYSCMNAGKSSALLQSAHNYTSRGMKVLLITSGIDDRYGIGNITSRIGLSSPAKLFNSCTNMVELILEDNIHYDCIFIDESQFLTREQVEQLTDVADLHRIPICCYGLRVDFKEELFEGSAALFALADKCVEMKTICYCGRKASQIAKIDPDGKMVSMDSPQIEIGGNDRYVSVCRKCYRHMFNERKLLDSKDTLN